MKVIKILFPLLIITILARAQDKAGLYDSLFTAMHNQKQFNGNVLIAEKGKVVYTGNFGMADRQHEIKLNDSTLFNTGSMSKLFTAIAILQLNEKNKLDLQDKVVKHLPSFPYSNIRIHHLLIHASGLPDSLLQMANWDFSKIATNEDILPVLYNEKPPLMFEPGEKSTYSNNGYMVLAEIVEAASGKKFEKYLQKNIFEPANMVHTGIYNSKKIKKVENVAKGYLFYPFTGKYERAIEVPEFSYIKAISGLTGDGNVYSTVDDLYNFHTTLNSGKLISKHSLKMSYTRYILARNTLGNVEFGNSYGYGWVISKPPHLLLQRGGELPGYVSNMIWDVKNDRIIIYLINDYLSYLSYHRQIFFAYMGIAYENKLNIPKLKAGIELSKIAITSTLDEMEAKINEIKANAGRYELHTNGLKFLVHKLQQLGKNKKAALMMRSFKPNH